MEKAMHLEEVAAIAGVSTQAIRKAVKAGHLRAGRAGRRLSFHPDEVRGYVYGMTKAELPKLPTIGEDR